MSKGARDMCGFDGTGWRGPEVHEDGSRKHHQPGISGIKERLSTRTLPAVSGLHGDDALGQG
jgi:hypothetical protein